MQRTARVKTGRVGSDEVGDVRFVGVAVRTGSELSVIAAVKESSPRVCYQLVPGPVKSITTPSPVNSFASNDSPPSIDLVELKTPPRLVVVLIAIVEE